MMFDVISFFGDTDCSMNSVEEFSNKNQKRFRFEFQSPEQVYEIWAENLNTATILAQAHAINRGWKYDHYRVEDVTIEKLNLFIDSRKLSKTELKSLKLLLEKAIYEKF